MRSWFDLTTSVRYRFTSPPYFSANEPELYPIPNPHQPIFVGWGVERIKVPVQKFTPPPNPEIENYSFESWSKVQFDGEFA